MYVQGRKSMSYLQDVNITKVGHTWRQGRFSKMDTTSHNKKWRPLKMVGIYDCADSVSTFFKTHAKYWLVAPLLTIS